MSKVDLNGIENLIFDLGRVIIDIDESATIKNLKKAGIQHPENYYNRNTQINEFDQLDKGQISFEEFAEKFIQSIDENVTFDIIANSWDQMLIGIPKERITLLKKLSEKYPLFLLSNTNERHVPQIYRMENRQYPNEKLFPFFKKEYFSFQHGMRKPDTAFFELVIKENQLNPSKTLFIDDSPIHIEGAKKTGLKTFHLNDEKTIIEVF